jgi:hypothetical protein
MGEKTLWLQTSNEYYTNWFYLNPKGMLANEFCTGEKDDQYLQLNDYGMFRESVLGDSGILD